MSLGLGEIIIILIIAFVVVGPEDLPKFARVLARGVRQIRGIYGEVKMSIGLDEEISQVKKDVSLATDSAKNVSGLGDISSDLQSIQKEIDQLKHM